MKIEKLRQELRELYKTRLDVNFRVRKLKLRAKKEGIQSIKVNETEKPKGPDSELSVVQAAMILGVSRDKLYRLLRSKKIEDLHPFTIGRFIRPTYINGSEPAEHLNSYQAWKSKWQKYAHRVEAVKEDAAKRSLERAQRD